MGEVEGTVVGVSPEFPQCAPCSWKGKNEGGNDGITVEIEPCPRQLSVGMGATGLPEPPTLGTAPPWGPLPRDV